MVLYQVDRETGKEESARGEGGGRRDVAGGHMEGTACNDVSSCCAPGVSGNGGSLVALSWTAPAASPALHHAFTRSQCPNEGR